MKTKPGENALMTVQEAIRHFQLSARKFHPILETDVPFVVIYYGYRKLIISEQLEHYLQFHPEPLSRKAERYEKRQKA